MFHVEHVESGSEKWSLARNPVAAWESIRTKEGLPKYLVAELGPDLLHRFQPKWGQLIRRPAPRLLCHLGL